MHTRIKKITARIKHAVIFYKQIITVCENSRQVKPSFNPHISLLSRMHYGRQIQKYYSVPHLQPFAVAC